MVNLSFNTIAKKKVRLEYDLPLIQKFCSNYHKNCKYLGLTGKDFGDILDWIDYINEIHTIEYDEKLIPELIKNIHENRLESKVKYYFGDIIKMINLNDYRITYPYDLINMDLLGTLIYQFNEKSAEEKLDRIEVFKKIIEKQAQSLKNGNAFIFLITLNAHRGKDITIFEKALKTLKRENNKEEIEWLLSPDNKVSQYQKIAYVLPSLILKNCINRFEVEDFKIILYQGKTNKMVHFIFFLVKNESCLDFSDINVKLLSKMKIIMIQRNGRTNEIKGKDFFSTKSPFKL